MTQADLIIIGGGPGGYPAAAAATRSGRKVVLIERDKLGGTCLNRGCIPTKALCRTAQVALTAAAASEFGVDCGAVKIDYERACDRRDAVVEQLRQGVTGMLAGVTVVNAAAKVVATAPQPVVEAEGECYTAPQLIIATGATPSRLPIEGAELAMTSDELLALRQLPESVAIIGAGVIGMEFASLLSAMGVKVTVLEFLPEILPGIDSEIAKRLRTLLKRRGIDIVTDAAVSAIRPGMKVEYQRKGKPAEVEAEAVVMAVGRRPVIPEGLDVELTPRGFVAVDKETMQTSAPGVFAVGDVNGICQLAHAATAQGLRAVGCDVALEPVPAAVFTEPEIGSVGLTEAQAKDRGLDFSVKKSMFRANGKAMALGETDGLMKILVDNADGSILGVHILGPHAADLVHELSTAMSAGVKAAEVGRAVHAHPTLSELIAETLHA